MTEPMTERTTGRTGHLLIRGGHILSMDPAVGDVPAGDLLIADGAIAAVGPRVGAGEDIPMIDATDCVVVPGFVDAHRHMWQTFLRGMLPDCTLATYMRDMLGKIAPYVRPGDGYTGNLLGALECLNGGITTVFDWSHALATPDDSDARIAALQDAGIRGYFAPNTPASAEWYSWDHPRTHPGDIRRLKDQYFTAPDSLLRLGAALRSPGQVPERVLQADWRLARELGAFISIHAGARHPGGPPREIEILDRLSLLGPDLNFAHGNEFTDDDLRRIRDTGGSIAMSPYAELVGGHGSLCPSRILAHGLGPALSADATAMAPGDMFSQMRLAYACGREEQQPADPAAPYEPGLTARDILAFATINGARAIGLGNVCGSLTVGKAADVVIIRGDAVNTAPIVDPVATVVQCAETGNVDTVLVNGAIVKRHGRLLAHDLTKTITAATGSRDRLLHDAGLNPV